MIVGVRGWVFYSHAVPIWKRLQFTHTHTHIHARAGADGRQLLCLRRCHVKDKQPRTALSWTIQQRVVIIPYGRFGTTYRSHLQGSSS